jgi:FkbM family methyltransferase
MGSTLALRVYEGLRLLARVRPADRPKVASYFMLNAVSKVSSLQPRAARRAIRFRDGLVLSFDTFSSQLGPYLEIYVSKIYERYPGFVGSPGQTIVDVGANIGLYALRQARAIGAAGHLFAFEPNPTAYELLAQNIEDNRLAWVRCFPCAVSSKNEEGVRLWRSNRWSSTASLSRDPKRTGDESISVSTTTLDDFVQDTGIEKIDILKMDTEGAEPLIVEGGLRHAIPITQRVVMESHRTREKVRDLLEPLGFTMVKDDRPNHIVYFARR